MASSSRYIEPLLPVGQIVTGETSSTWTFTKAVAGFATKASSTTSTYTFSKAVVGYATKAGVTASTYTFTKAVSGFATKASSTASTWTFTKTVDGYAIKDSATSSTWLFTSTTAGHVATPATPSPGCDLQLEMGGSILLENGFALLLETCVPSSQSGPGRRMYRPRVEPAIEDDLEDEEAFVLVLASIA